MGKIQFTPSPQRTKNEPPIICVRFTKTKTKTTAAETTKIMTKPMNCGIADELFGKGLGLLEEVGIDVGVDDGGDKEVGDGVFVANVGDVVGVVSGLVRSWES